MKVHVMKEKVQRFMIGRYGFDELSKIFLGLTIALMVASMFTRNRVIYLISLVLLVYSYWRAFSRNIAKRQQENQRFLNLRYQSAVNWSKFKSRREQKKIYRFYKCPQCQQMVRVPKGRGRICITCPKCQAEFIRKS